jgi:ubiquinone/menaquinone biosynthesis C-methylase UbiE
MRPSREQGQKPISTREWYDFIGQLADILPGLHLGGKQATNTLLETCRLDAESLVLDVGCGPGNTAILIGQKYGSQVLGIDISEVMVAQAKDRARRHGLTDKVAFRAANIFWLPFEDDCFDIVIVESVLTTLPGDKQQALMEMVRVLRPGGRIGINETTIDPSAPAEFLKLLDEHPAIHGHFTPQTLRNFFEQAGLQEVYSETDTKGVETLSALKQMGLRGLLSFLVRTYPKILLKLLRDARFREAGRVDDEITKRGKQIMGYTLVVAQKPG